MRGIVFLGNRKLELREFPDPTPGPGEVVLAMKASGMCGSDFHAYRATGDAAAGLGLGSGGGPVIAGHEPCGVVHAVGAGVDPALVGQRVMLTHRWRLEQAEEAYRLFDTQTTGKGVFVF
jgi:threonine dehydrogenase-like Zn-dependent dehydrogenase